MEKVKTDRYMILNSTVDPKKRYWIDCYTELKPGDIVAVQHGNIADIEVLNAKNKHNLILGKAIGVITALP